MFKSVAIALAAGSALAGGISAAEAATPVTIQVSLDNVSLSSGQTYNGSIDLSSYLTGSNGERYAATGLKMLATAGSTGGVQDYSGNVTTTYSVLDVEATYNQLRIIKNATNVTFEDVTPFLQYRTVVENSPFLLALDTGYDSLVLTAGGAAGSSIELPGMVQPPKETLLLGADLTNSPIYSLTVPLVHADGTSFDVLDRPFDVPYVLAKSLTVAGPALPPTTSGVYVSYFGTIYSGSLPDEFFKNNFLDLPVTRGTNDYPVSAIDPTTGILNYTLTANTNGVIGVGNLQVYLSLEQIDSVAPVPEPATWAMMLIGFGAVGAAIRRRRTIVRFA